MSFPHILRWARTCGYGELHPKVVSGRWRGDGGVVGHLHECQVAIGHRSSILIRYLEELVDWFALRFLLENSYSYKSPPLPFKFPESTTGKRASS